MSRIGDCKVMGPLLLVKVQVQTVRLYILGVKNACCCLWRLIQTLEAATTIAAGAMASHNTSHDIP